MAETVTMNLFKSALLLVLVFVGLGCAASAGAIFRFASFPVAKNAAIDPTSLPAYHAVAQYLMKNPDSR
jgi:hypothetical protein